MYSTVFSLSRKEPGLPLAGEGMDQGHLGKIRYVKIER